MLYHEITIGILSLKNDSTRHDVGSPFWCIGRTDASKTLDSFAKGRFRSGGSDLGEALYRWNTSTISPARRELTVICGPAPPKEMWSDPNLSLKMPQLRRTGIEKLRSKRAHDAIYWSRTDRAISTQFLRLKLSLYLYLVSAVQEVFSSRTWCFLGKQGK